MIERKKHDEIISILADLCEMLGAEKLPDILREDPSERDIRWAFIYLREELGLAEKMLSGWPAEDEDRLDKCCDGIEYCREHNPGGRLA